MILCLIHTACQRLEGDTYYKRLTPEGPRLWTRLCIALATTLLMVALACGFGWAAPRAFPSVVFASVGGAALLLIPSLTGGLAAARTHHELQSDAFQLLRMAAPKPTTLVDAFAGAALYTLWPVWLAALCLATLLGPGIIFMLPRTPFTLAGGVAAGLGAVSVGAAAVWVSIWAGVIAATLHQDRVRAISAGVFQANVHAAMGAITVLLPTGIVSVALYFLLVVFAVTFLPGIGFRSLQANILSNAAALISGVGVLSVMFVRLARNRFSDLRDWAILEVRQRLTPFNQ